MGANEERAAARKQRIEGQRRAKERGYSHDEPAVLDTVEQIRQFQETCAARIHDYPDDHPDRGKNMLAMGELDARAASLSD